MKARKLFLFVLAVSFCIEVPAQNLSLENQALKVQNLMLRRQVDSLRRELNYRAYRNGGKLSSLDGLEVVNTWDLLRDGGSYIEDASVLSGKNSGTRKGFYEERLSSLDPSLMVEYDDRLAQYIESYVVARRDRMTTFVGRYEGYEDYFREVFSKYGVPGDLTALCVVESAVNPRAESFMGAAGLWQLMPETAVEYGLSVGMNGDERFDVAKSTDAAARMLASLHRFFGSWPLAVCAYNCGSGNVSKAISKAGGRRDFWSIYDYLPEETRAYLPSFIATLYYIYYR